MNMHEAAAALDGCQYRKEGSRELFREMKTVGLVAIFGASDDLMEFRGAVDDEIGAWEGATAYLTSTGLLENECDSEECPYHDRAKARAAKVEAIWDDGSGSSWSYKTDLPHATFKVMEDDEVYCVGIVIALADCPS